MPNFHLCSEITVRAERFQAQFNAARTEALAALPGNPFGAEVQRFGDEGVAAKIRHPLLQGKNRIHGFCAEHLSLLDDLLAFYRDDGLSPSVSVPQGQMTPELFGRLTAAGLWSAGSGTVPARVTAKRNDEKPAADILIRISGLEEKELYLDLFQSAFAPRRESDREYRAIQWAEDTLPGSVRYLAEIGGRPIGMASFPILGGVGYFGTGGVLPEFRGHGVQGALIRRRLADAPALGCGLVLGGGSPGETTYRNFERAGLRLIPIGMTWKCS